jgi:hypothetical protein
MSAGAVIAHAVLALGTLVYWYQARGPGKEANDYGESCPNVGHARGCTCDRVEGSALGRRVR